MKISLKKAVVGGNHLPGQPAGTRYEVVVEDKKGNTTTTLCHMDHWAFDCCGIASLFGFGRDYGSSPTWWDNKENTLTFIKFLEDNAEFDDGWAPKEYIFALAGRQFKEEDSWGSPYMRHLVAYPKVKQFDRFLNKAHGPAHIYMFRLSLTSDFTHLNKKEKE